MYVVKWTAPTALPYLKDIRKPEWVPEWTSGQRDAMRFQTAEEAVAFTVSESMGPLWDWDEEVRAVRLKPRSR